MVDDTPIAHTLSTKPTSAPATVTLLPAVADGTVGVAITTVAGRPTPSPDQLVPQTVSSSKSDLRSPHTRREVKVSYKPSIEDTRDGDTSRSHHGARYAGTTETELFISTPSPFKKQKLAWIGTNDSRSVRNDSLHMRGNEGQVHVKNPYSVEVIAGLPSLSNFQGDHLLSGSLLQSPDPLLCSTDISDTDFDFLGREVVAAASTASAMLSRFDGFDAMPAYPVGSGVNDGATLLTVPSRTTDINLSPQYSFQDAFPLPPYLQVHLDETHAESTALIPHILSTDGANGCDGTVPNHGSVFFQLVADSPMIGYDPNCAPGTTPPSVSSRFASIARGRGDGTTMDFKGNNIGRGKTLEQLAQVQKNSKIDKARPRKLPLRKRKFQLNDSDDDEYQPPTTSEVAEVPVGKKRTLVRHNVRSDDGDRITCKCSKSKCLKVRL